MLIVCCRCYRWRGSIYKLIWRDFLLYAVLYYSVTILHKYLLTVESQRLVYMKSGLNLLYNCISVKGD